MDVDIIVLDKYNMIVDVYLPDYGKKIRLELRGEVWVMMAIEPILDSVPATAVIIDARAVTFTAN